jgi:hypothetical protein
LGDSKSESVGVRMIARIEVERCDRDLETRWSGGVRVCKTKTVSSDRLPCNLGVWSDATVLSTFYSGCLPLSSHIRSVWHFLIPLPEP